MLTSFKRSLVCTAALSAPALQQATVDTQLPWRLLDTQKQVWVSLLWGHCSFLLGPGVYTVLFVPSKSLFPQSYVSPVALSSVAQSCLTLRPHEWQHTRPPCPSPTPGVHSDSRPLSQCCHPAISSSVVPFSSCSQSLPASESFPMSQLFA